MAIILNIDTAVDSASICLACDNIVIDECQNPEERESGSWLHIAIDNLLKKNKYTLTDIDAIAVSMGPGSYTGLRVSMATAKGLCYALSIPLISISTLQMMAAAIKDLSTSLLCPMIDARRMEVFYAIYTKDLQTWVKPTNAIVDNQWLLDELASNTISFFGNGSHKVAKLIQHPNAFFISSHHSAKDMVSLSIKKYELNQFSDLAYAEPFYGKAFYSTISKKIY